MFRQSSQSRFSFRLGWFSSSYKLWNCLAFHLVVDDSQRIMTFTWAIPWIFTLIIDIPLIPTWLGSHYLSGGTGERAEYGVWHDYYETKLQWRRIINLGGKRGGHEWRVTHRHGSKQRVFRQETLISAWVADIAQPWVEANHINRWKLTLNTWFAPSAHWWVPALYDHFFVLHAERNDGIDHEATVKAHINKKLSADQVFKELTEMLVFE